MGLRDSIKGVLTWSSLLVIAPLAFFGLYAVLLLDALLAKIFRTKSGYEDMLDQWELHHDD